MLNIENLSVSMDGKTLLSDINLRVKAGARHLICGHNGSGKSTLAAAIAGDARYKIDGGKIIFEERDITNENATSRALLGIFLGAQNVPEIPGLTVLSFLKHSMAAHTHFQTGKDLAMGDFLMRLESAREQLSIPKEWLNRAVNVGFSGGERKRLMLLRLVMTAPRLAILDEPDSGADADAQQLIANTIHNMPDTTFIFVSHQDAFTRQISPTDITTLSHGKVVIK